MSSLPTIITRAKSTPHIRACTPQGLASARFIFNNEHAGNQVPAAYCIQFQAAQVFLPEEDAEQAVAIRSAWSRGQHPGYRPEGNRGQPPIF